MCHIQVSNLSRLYLTPPWGQIDQPSFLNAVAAIRFDGSAPDLLEHLLQIELEMGRVREKRWGPRIIDLDILEFMSQEISLPHLEIPHPRYHTRAFVLHPLRELVPDMIPTGQKLTVSQLCDQIPPEDIRPYAPIADYRPTP